MADYKYLPSGHKRALIIGNNKYIQQHNQLGHSINSAHKLKDVLEDIGFDVTLYTDIDVFMMDIIIDFAKTTRKGDLVLFYFCGHCQQVDGKNYMIPIDDSLISEDIDVQDIGINAENALQQLSKQNQCNATIFILDAVRPYFFNTTQISNWHK